MLKLVTLLVLVIALIAGAFAQEHTTVAAAPASAPQRGSRWWSSVPKGRG